jgi:hypothetical protein
MGQGQGLGRIQIISAFIFSLFMLASGLFIPFIVPANQQNEVLIMTFFFTLTGMIMLQPLTPFLRQKPQFSRMTYGAGWTLAVVGGVLPWLRIVSNPDERFLWMIAYMPVVIGGLTLANAMQPILPQKSRQQPQTPQTAANISGVKRSQVLRVPQSSFYQRILPIILIVISIFIVISLLIVILPVLWTFLN